MNRIALLLILMASAPRSVKSKVCVPNDACSCTLDSGEVISLWGIDDPNEPRYIFLYIVIYDIYDKLLGVFVCRHVYLILHWFCEQQFAMM